MEDSAAAAHVTVVMVTYNSCHVLAASLAPLRAFPHVTVVDNASHDGTADEVRHLLPQAQVIRNDINVGFGRANNIALERATTAYALILNPDCVLEPGALARLVAAARQYPAAAILAPKVLDETGAVANSFRPFFHAKKPRQLIEPQGDLCAEWLLGAAMLLDLAHLRKVGFFDPWFFLFYEEEDLCMRVRRAGLSSVLVNDARAMHAGRKSSKPSQALNLRIIYCMTLSRLYIARKYLGPGAMLRKWLSVLIGGLLVLPLYLVILNKRQVLRVATRVWAAVRAPMELRARHCLEHRRAAAER